jgi:hypothetical protein
MLLGAVWLVGCGPGDVVAPEGRQPVSVALDLGAGETRIVPGRPLALTFRAVLADSRCPVDVVCAWQGDGAVEVGVTRAGARSTQPFVFHTADPDDQVLRDGRLRLVTLNPAPHAGVPIPPADYRIRLEFSRP